MSVQVKLELGHRASLREKPTVEGFTHDWIVFVRGPESYNIQHFVDKVVFHLHESFPRPKRVVKEPPYQVSESGYAGFNMPIEVYFRNKEEPKKVQFEYDLFLRLEGPPVSNIRYEKLTFQNPTEDFRRKLLKAGGQQAGSVAPTSGNSSVSGNASLQSQACAPTQHGKVEHIESKDSQRPLLNPQIKSSQPEKKQTLQSEKKRSHSSTKDGSKTTTSSSRPSQPFTDIFGSPIKSKASPDPANKQKESASSHHVSQKSSSSSKTSKSSSHISSVSNEVKTSSSKEHKPNAKEKEPHPLVSKEPKHVKVPKPNEKEGKSQKRPPSPFHSQPSSEVSVKKRCRSASTSSATSSTKSVDGGERKVDTPTPTPTPAPAPTLTPTPTPKVKVKETKDIKEKREKHKIKSSSSSSSSLSVNTVKKEREREKTKIKPLKSSPKSQKLSPKPKKSPPKSQRLSPKHQKLSPKHQKSSPKIQTLSPKLHKSSPKTLKLSPKPQKSSPKVQLSPRPQKSSLDSKLDKTEAIKSPKSSSQNSKLPSSQMAIQDPISNGIEVVESKESKVPLDTRESSPASSISLSSLPPGGVHGPLAAMMEEMENELLSPLSSDPGSPPHLKSVKDKNLSSEGEPEDNIVDEKPTSTPFRTEWKQKETVKSEKTSDQINLESNHKTSVQSTDDKKAVKLRHIDQAYLSELVELQQQIMALQDHQLLQRIADVIEETGQYQVTSTTFDFDLCLLDQNTVKKLQGCLVK